MTFKFSAPEILILASCALLISHQNLHAYLFLILGIIGCIARASIESHLRTEAEKLAREKFNTTIGIIGNIINSLSYAISQRDDEQTEDPSDYN